MLVTGAPQFPTQDDSGFGSGIASIPQWELASMEPDSQDRTLDELDVDPDISNIFNRLRNIFNQPQLSQLTITELHDLTSFVAYRLLLLPPLSPTNSTQSAISECLRYALALYMLIIHGSTFYPHVHLAADIIQHLKRHLDALAAVQENCYHSSLGIWTISMGLATTIGTADYQWFVDHAIVTAKFLSIHTWEDVHGHLDSILWMKMPHEDVFRQIWEEILTWT